MQLNKFHVQLAFLVLKSNGGITCRVTGVRRHSTNLTQGEVEFPCLLIYTGELKEISKLMALLKSRRVKGIFQGREIVNNNSVADHACSLGYEQFVVGNVDALLIDQEETMK